MLRNKYKFHNVSGGSGASSSNEVEEKNRYIPQFTRNRSEKSQEVLKGFESRFWKFDSRVSIGEIFKESFFTI